MFSPTNNSPSAKFEAVAVLTDNRALKIVVSDPVMDDVHANVSFMETYAKRTITDTARKSFIKTPFVQER